MPAPGTGDAESRVYRLRGVDVLTRIGADYVIAPAGGIDDRTLPRLTLPADEVYALMQGIEAEKQRAPSLVSVCAAKVVRARLL